MNEKADLLPEQRFLRSILNTRELYSASSGLLCGSFASDVVAGIRVES